MKELRHTLFFFIVLSLLSCNESGSFDKESETDQRALDSISESASYYHQGKEYYRNGDIEKAKEAYKLALEKSTSNDFSEHYKYFSRLIGIYLSKNEYGDAISLIKEFDELTITPDDQKKKAVYAAYISTYTGSLQFDNALDYISKLKELSKNTNDDEYLIHAAICESVVYHKLGNNKEASKILNDLVNDNSEISLLQQSYIFGDIGIYEFYQGEFENAIEYYTQSLSKKRQLTNQDQINNIAVQYANIAEAYIELNELDKAKVYLDSFKSLNQGKIDNTIRRGVFKYELRIARLENEGNNRVENLIDKITLDQETFYTERYNKELESLTAEKERSENLLIKNQIIEIEKLKFRNNAFIVGSLLLLFLLIISGVIFKQRRDHLMSSLLNQQRLLRSQMNPHFTFNILSSIQSLVRKDAKEAATYITKFSRLLRLILENSTQSYVPLEDEVEILYNYLDLQKLRFPDIFDYQIEIATDLENELISIPPMLIQPFVENAIEHGFRGITYKGIVKISLKPLHRGKHTSIQCSITDNGIGYNPINSNKNKKGTSLALISDFILKSTGTAVKIAPLKEPDVRGTSINFTIPTQ